MPTSPARNKKLPAVASLSPAATDLLIGMGAGDHLVAVSNFDADRDDIRGLEVFAAIFNVGDAARPAIPADDMKVRRA